MKEINLEDIIREKASNYTLSGSGFNHQEILDCMREACNQCFDLVLQSDEMIDLIHEYRDLKNCVLNFKKQIK